MKIFKDNSTFKKYPAYKDSEIEWSGFVPETWEALPIRAIFEERNEKNEGRKTDYILSVTKDRGVIPYDEKGAIGNNKSEDIERYKLVYPNDFVINKMNVVIGSLGMSKYFGAFSQVYLVYKPRTSQININYYAYIFSNPSFYKSLIKYCTGIMDLRESLNKEDFKKLILPFPDYQTQTAIVDYLDRKTAQIDQCINIKEKQIELLKERKQILIHKAVTRGLDPNVNLKDSGFKSLGHIPEGWEIADLRRFVLEHRQGYYSEGGYTDTGHRVVRITDLLDNNIIDISDSPFYKVNEESRIRYELKIGDFLFQRTGSHKKIGIFNSDEPSIYASYLIRFRFNNKINHKYLLCFLNSEVYIEQLNEQIHGGVNPNINAENIKICKVILPPLDIQCKILDFIETISEKIFTTISLKVQEIEKLKEYKATLINSAVTGKIKVYNDGK